jgi:hypothetical protein
MLVFYGEGVVSPPPSKPKTEELPFVGYPQLLIQYICSYPQDLEAVSSICIPRMFHAVVIGAHLTREAHIKMERPIFNTNLGVVKI